MTISKTEKMTYQEDLNRFKEAQIDGLQKENKNLERKVVELEMKVEELQIKLAVANQALHIAITEN